MRPRGLFSVEGVVETDGEAAEGTLVSTFSHAYHSLPVYVREVIEMAHCSAGSSSGGGGSKEALTGGEEAARGGDAGLVRLYLLWMVISFLKKN